MANSGPGIHLDATAFVNSCAALSRPRLDQPVALALVDTAKAGIVKGAALIARRTGLRSGTVKERIRYDRVKTGDYRAVVRSSRRPIAMIEFPGVRQTNVGVQTRAWGRAQVLQSAFITTTSRGGTQVFWRRGRARLPIKKLWGPTIYGTFATPEVQTAITSTMRTRLAAALIRRIASEQRRRR